MERWFLSMERWFLKPEKPHKYGISSPKRFKRFKRSLYIFIVL